MNTKLKRISETARPRALSRTRFIATALILALTLGGAIAAQAQEIKTGAGKRHSGAQASARGAGGHHKHKPVAGPADPFWDLNGTTTGAGTTPNGTWSTSVANWNPLSDGTGSLANWVSGNVAVFSAGTDATGSYTVTVSGTITAGSITFEEGTVTLAGTLTPVLNIGTGGVTINSTINGTTTFGSSLGTILLGGTTTTNQTWANNSSQNFVVNSGVEISKAGTLTLGGSGSGSITGVISQNAVGGGNVGKLVKTGAGTFTLSGASTYSGGTTINAGTILIGVSNVGSTSGALGTGAVLLGDTANANNASLLTNGAFTFSNAITVQSGNTGVATIGGNTDNNSTFSGAITLNHDLTVSQVANAGANALSITGGISSGSGTKTVTFAGPGNINVSTTAISDGIGGRTVAVNVTGGKTTFNIANTYTGLTNITGGTLVEGISNAINTGALTVNGSTAVFDLGASHTDSVGTVTLDGGGSITGTGTSALTSTGTFEMKSGSASAILAGTGIALNKTTAGTVTLSGANTYTGATTISTGTLSVSSLANGGAASNIGQSTNAAANLVFDGGTLQYTGGSVSTDRNFTINTGKTATIDVSTGATNLTISGASTATNGALTKIGAGTLTLTGANAYSGATTINAGTLKLDNAGSTTARLANTNNITVNSGGTLLLASSSGTSTDRINNSATMSLNGGTFNTGGLSEHGATNNTAGLGALTLQSTSTIDMGSLASIVAFANSSAQTWSGTLNIYDWSGNFAIGGGTDQLYVGIDPSGLTASQLAEVSFYSDNGTTFLGNAAILADGEIVPIPEPGTWAAGGLALGGLVCWQRRRYARFFKRRP